MENVYEMLPIVTITTPETSWHCILKQEDYVKLFQLIEAYKGGELIY